MRYGGGIAITDGDSNDSIKDKDRGGVLMSELKNQGKDQSELQSQGTRISQSVSDGASLNPSADPNPDSDTNPDPDLSPGSSPDSGPSPSPGSCALPLGELGEGARTGLTQRGILRTNCVDCLDRTNVAQVPII